MKETILELDAREVRMYFLQSSRYCTIDLPQYFDFQSLLDNLDEKLRDKKITEIYHSKPGDCEKVNYKFLTNKDGNLAWRPLQIINPAIYICLVNRMVEHWDEIQNRFKDFQANNKIICYSIPLSMQWADNQLKTDVSESIVNWWEEIEQQSIYLALKYNYVLITDISDCYSSIYTHTIAWALHDKQEAREHKHDDTYIGCAIDDILQSMSYRQTNGIPQGCVLMDFIAEMVLGYADKELTKRLKEYNSALDYRILRYRDDYRIFTKNQEDAITIAKLLSEILSDLNLKLNTQKTLISNNIIRDVIKPDKLFWNEMKHDESTLQKKLLLIYSLSEKHPNSGSLSAALSNFIDALTPSSVLQESSLMPLISILVNLAYNNPRLYSAVVVSLGKILSVEADKSNVERVYDLIRKKFEDKPNVGYWKVWFQRLTIKEDREKEQNSDEKLCQIAAGNDAVQLWDISWLKAEYQNIFQCTTIFNENLYKETPIIPDKNEVKLFGY